MAHRRDSLGYSADVGMSAPPISIEPPPPGPVLDAGEELSDGAGGRLGMLGLIGKGGMGEVHRAEWWRRGAEKSEIVAVKVMLAKTADDPKALVRFGAEGKALKEIRHPNVVRVLATGVRKRDHLAWMAMELLRGKTLHEIIEQHGKLPVPWAIEIIRDVCRGLGAVHSIAIHRDIKPQNLFMCSDGAVRILDLGVSKFLHRGLVHTTTGFQVGSVPYMSPEQIRNIALDARSDLFSLSIVLYQLLTGRYPFAYDGGTMPGWFEVCSHIVEKPHFPPDHPECAPWLERPIVEILNRGLAKERERRFRSAKEMEDVLTAALGRLADELGPGEPLTTFAATLAVSEEAPPPTPEVMPRTTLPMSPPVGPQRSYDVDSERGEAVLSLTPPSPVADELLKVQEHTETSLATPRTTLPLVPLASAVRVSHVAMRRPESAQAASPFSAQHPLTSEDVAPEAPSASTATSIASSSATSIAIEPAPTPDVELLAQMIEGLPDELRQPFVLNQIHNRPIDEIAERMGVPAATVQQRVLVARAWLSAEMREQRRADAHVVAVSASLEADEPKTLGPKGTVKMIESASALLSRQGKTLDQARAEANAGATSNAARPRGRASEVIALGAVLGVALFSGGMVFYLLRERASSSQDVSALPATTATATTATTATATTATTATTALPATTATTATAAGVTTTVTAAPTATSVPSTTANPARKSGAPTGTPNRRPPKNEPFEESPTPKPPKKSGPLFQVEQ